MPEPTHIDAIMYAQIEPEWRTYSNHDNPDHIRAAKVVALTQKPPGRPRTGTVTVKLTVRVPRAAFVALRPEAVIEIPTDLVQGNPVEVVAEDPNQ